MDLEQTRLPTEHLGGIKVDGIAYFDEDIQLDTTIKLSGDFNINGIEYNNLINDLRDVILKYQK